MVERWSLDNLEKLKGSSRIYIRDSQRLIERFVNALVEGVPPTESYCPASPGDTTD